MATKLTASFTLEELIASATAQRLGINNTPDNLVKMKLKTLCEKILQPLRNEWSAPVIVTCGYRCPAVNKAVGGVANSDHLYGNAADIRTVSDTPANNKKLFDLAVKLMKNGKLKDVKQIIDEYGYNWIHISYQDGRTTKRNQVLHIK